MPFISVIVPTMRVGGLDFLCDSLERQTFRDFELVLSDGLYSRRAEIVAEAAKRYSFPIRHVQPNPNPFPLNAFCAYANAGLVAARGEVALFCVDYTELQVDIVGLHAEFHRIDNTGRRGLMAPHQYYTFQPHSDFPRYTQDPSDSERYAEDVAAGKLDRFMWSSGTATDEVDPKMGGADPKLGCPDGDIAGVFFHAKNESVRLEHAIAINGWDEDLDGSHCYQDSDFGDRLTIKRGIEWQVTSHPNAVARIINPRHVFPFPRRLRPIETNNDIWQAKKAAGYPEPNKWNLRDRRNEAVKLNIAMVYGEFSSAIHGGFDIAGLYTKKGLTGSESSFFNLARTLAERGHEVAVFCVCGDKPVQHESGFIALPIKSIMQLPKLAADVVIAWNEPDYLMFAPPGAVRICDQQLNDWGFCRPGWQDLIDHIVFPSENSRQHHIKDEGIAKADKCGSVIANSVDLELFEGEHDKACHYLSGKECNCDARVVRSPHRVVWCSSPDRGLHHLLGMWPLIRQRVPDAELRIFYRLEPWIKHVRDLDEEVGRRARYIEETLPKLKDMGVTVVGPVPNAQMARELRGAAVLAYPCDPIRYTEGFGCSVLDAAAGGCVPVISDADALPSVHQDAAICIGGKPTGVTRGTWVKTVADILEMKDGVPQKWRETMADHAEKHSREAIADQWELLLLDMVK